MKFYKLHWSLHAWPHYYYIDTLKNLWVSNDGTDKSSVLSPSYGLQD